MKIYCTLILSVFTFTIETYSQKWTEMMNDPSVNFYDVQKEFNKWFVITEKERENEKARLTRNNYSEKNYTQQNEEKEIEGSWLLYKRWEAFVAPRVYGSGDRTLFAKATEEYIKWLALQKGKNPIAFAGNWKLLSPTTVPSGGGAGRINAVRFDPNNSNIVYACAPCGGLWKSTNGGTGWQVWNTDGLPTIGATDIAIDSSNSNTMYLATGDGEVGETYSLGVYKSTDGGVTWNPTGLSWLYSQSNRITKLLIDPGNSQKIIAATSNGMYYSSNGGTSWSIGQTGNFTDAEFQPGNSSIVYAVTSSTFYKSTNGGTSYSTVSIPKGATNRLSIAVSPADAQVVWVLAGLSSNSGFEGVYKSTNAAGSFTKITTTSPSNILGWNASGNDSGGQSWYDLGFACSPTNANEIVAGGVNVWKSINGGTSFSIIGHWTGSGASYVHADIHDISYSSSSSIWIGSDGGVFRSTNGGTNFSDLSSGLAIAQIYRLSTSATNASLNLSGHQDNGTNRTNGAAWSQVLGGDGMECIIDHSNPQIMYAEYSGGDISKSTNGGASFVTTIASSGGSGVNASGNWVTPYIMNPANAQELLVGKAGLYKTINGGSSWNACGTMSGGTGNVVAIAYAPSNTQVIYAAKSNAIFKSTNGGASFSNITSGLPGGVAITYIAVCGNDPNKVYVSFSGFNAAEKVYMSSNGGANWTNISIGLPNFSANTIVYQNNSNDVLYVGTDVGVFVRSASQSTWANYNTGLPNVIISELEINYSAGKLRAATYGRSMWESDLYTAGASLPVANFTSNMNNVCPGGQVQFTDQSSFNPNAWSWIFQGGTPGTSTQQNPLVTYNAVGTYAVTLWTTNVNGTDSVMKTSYITVLSTQALPLQEGFIATQFLPPNWSAYDALSDNVFWERSATVGGFGTSTECSWFDNNINNGGGGRDEMRTPPYNCSNALTLSLTFDVAYTNYDNQYSDTLGVFASTDCGLTWTQLYMKGGQTLATAPPLTTGPFVPSNTQWRTENITLNQYTGQPSLMIAFQNRGWWGNNLYVDNINLSFTVNVNENNLVSLFNVYPNPNQGNFETYIEFPEKGNYSVIITNVVGQAVFSESLNNFSGKYHKQFNFNNFEKGVYLFNIVSEKSKLVKKIVIY